MKMATWPTGILVSFALATPGLAASVLARAARRIERHRKGDGLLVVRRIDGAAGALGVHLGSREGRAGEAKPRPS